MGVKGLWTLLGPFCERKSLYEIRGETVAVDLSGWVCDSQNVADYHAQPKLYLRNLYFRTSYLLLCGVTPVFVLEGEAPAMKKDVMAARNLIQFRGNPTRAPPKPGKRPDTSRRRFLQVLTQCEKLLSSMGLACVRGAGEAEAMCAHLNSVGLVSAVISQDSDCFVYGATRLYRNFTVSGAGAGTVDVYDLKRVQQSMDIGRNKMVALALLCGSDYNGTGVEGVGHATAVSFLMQHSEGDIIDRLVSWSTETDKYESWRRRVEDPTSCTSCGHGGSVQSHNRHGCPTCVTHKGCSTDYREWRARAKTELQIRSKALAGVEAFPAPALLQEFLFHREATPSHFSPNWGCPDLIKFIRLMAQWLCWTESYCLEKFLPLLTRWQLLHFSTTTRAPLHPSRINKKRTPKGIPCYEVVWTDPEGHYAGLITDEQVESETDLENLWTTVERQDLIQKAYPKLVQEYEDSKKKPKGRKKKNPQEGDLVKLFSKNKKKAGKEKSVNPEESIRKLETSMKLLSVDISPGKKGKRQAKRKAAGDVSLKTKSRKTKKKMDNIKNDSMQKLINTYLNKSQNINFDTENVSKKNSHISKFKELNIRDCKNMSPILLRKSYLFENKDTTAELLKNLSCDPVEDDVSESELSNIVDNIIKRKDCMDLDISVYEPSEQMQNFSTPVKSVPSNSDNKECRQKRRVSYFFGNLDDDFDAFEKSIDLKNAPDLEKIPSEESDPNKTVEYDITKYSPVVRISNNFRRSQQLLDHSLGFDGGNEQSLDIDEKIEMLERRLFEERRESGANEKENFPIVNSCKTPNRNVSSHSLAYTPLEERIRRIKENL